jgi:hypothetical protein
VLELQPRMAVSVGFEDRGGHRRYTRLWFPSSLHTDALRAYMDYWIARTKPITDAHICSWEAQYTIEDFTKPVHADTSDTGRRVVLYYSNGPVWDRLIIPSPRPALFETMGAYAGIRLDTANLMVQAILLGLQEVVSYVVTSDGEPFPPQFQVAGLVL